MVFWSISGALKFRNFRKKNSKNARRILEIYSAFWKNKYSKTKNLTPGPQLGAKLGCSKKTASKLILKWNCLILTISLDDAAERIGH